MNMQQLLLNLNTIQNQIQTNGAFAPLYWLLEAGILPFDTYDAWRRKKINFLDSGILVGNDNLDKLISNTTHYAKSLGLEPELQTFYSWADRAQDRPLTPSRNQQLDQWLRQKWCRPETIQQMDLFMDSGVTAVENDLIDHLKQQRWQLAQLSYQRLSEWAPTHPHLSRYQLLLHYGLHISAEEAPAIEQMEHELRSVILEIVPVAREMLGHGGLDYLTPVWQRFIPVLPAERFDPDAPDLHLSYVLTQLGSWPAVIQAIQQVPAFHEHQTLLMRMANAYCFHSPEQAMLIWAFITCLPRCDEFQLNALTNPRFRRNWCRFVDTELPLTAFPAWLLMTEQGLIHHLTELPTPPISQPDFLAMQALINSRNRSDIELRRKLREANPALFSLYLVQK